MTLLRTAFANPRIARLEVVWAAATLVRWALAILVALYAYRLGGAAAVGVVAAVRMVPAALAAPRLAVVADRRSRRTVLLVSLAARLALAAGLWATVVTGGSLVLLVALASAYGIAEALHKPTQAALLGVHARNPTELAAANTLWSILDNAAFLLGSLLVGILVALAGLAAAFAACLVPLVVAVLVLVGLPRDVPPPPLPAERSRDILLAGVRAISGDAQLRLLTLVLAVDMFVQAVVDVLLVVVALGVLDLGEGGAGWLSAAWGVGGVVGGGVAAALLARRRLAPGVLGGLVVAGLPLVAIAAVPEGGLALAMLVVLGIGFGVIEVALLFLTQRLVPADVLGRVYGAQETVTIVAMTAGSVAASGLVLALGERGALTVAGLVLPALAIGLGIRIGRLDAGTTANDADFELLRGVAPFATLPVATVENLAIRAGRRTVEPGEEVIRQGDPGDTFYVIDRGTVEVLEDGRHRRHQGPGEFFGEIALLTDSVRTATVRATSAMELLALERPEFLAAISAHPRTRIGLDEVARDRLGPAE